MPLHYNALNRYGARQQVEIDRNPDHCPQCKKGIDPIDMNLGFFSEVRPGVSRLERVFRCPRLACEKLFIGRYARRDAGYGLHLLVACLLYELDSIEFGEPIAIVSPSFCEIYNEANKAEQYGLKLVAGAGYRKSLEFLIKDYLIGLTPADTEAIKKQPLAACIKERVANGNIVTTASRAAWLGNDEVHYERKWEGKDLEDLKVLIQLTLRWIEMEKLTEKVAKDMPDPKETPKR